MVVERKPLVIANWKMNGTFSSIRPLCIGLSEGLINGCNAEVVICPAYVYLAELAERFKGLAVTLGGQNVSHIESGAFTGEISAQMLRDFACKYVIIGHSERRMLYGETDDLVAKKFIQAQATSLVPILCVGEQLAEMEAGATETVIERQLSVVMDSVDLAMLDKCVIAYEPIWAIGTNHSAKPEQIQVVHRFVRSVLSKYSSVIADKIRVIYGGSVNAKNVAEIFNIPDVDGCLVGGASLKIEEFLNICSAVKG